MRCPVEQLAVIEEIAITNSVNMMAPSQLPNLIIRNLDRFCHNVRTLRYTLRYLGEAIPTGLGGRIDRLDSWGWTTRFENSCVILHNVGSYDQGLLAGRILSGGTIP